MDTFEEETEGFHSSEEIPKTQVYGVGGQISVEVGQRGGLDFDDHMTQLQQGRSRYRICASIMHVNFIGNESQQCIPQALSVESERHRRMGLTSACTWAQRNQSQSDFRVKYTETIIGGSHNTPSTPVSIVRAIRCS